MPPKTIPSPGYTTTKKLLAPISTMLSEVGAQDACIQLQELSVRHLSDVASAAGIVLGEFLKPLYKSYGIPHGTYDFKELRELMAKSYLVLTYALLEKMLKEVIAAYKSLNASNSAAWVTKNAAGERLSPLQELEANLPKPLGKRLRDCPEFALLEYYRVVRVANSHVKGATFSRAEKDFKKISPKRHTHFSKCYGVSAPNSPKQISFEDFLLFTRAIKYYSRMINELCA